MTTNPNPQPMMKLAERIAIEHSRAEWWKALLESFPSLVEKTHCFHGLHSATFYIGHEHGELSRTDAVRVFGESGWIRRWNESASAFDLLKSIGDITITLYAAIKWAPDDRSEQPVNLLDLAA